MKTMNWSKVLGRSIGASLSAAATVWLLLGYAVAGPVVQSTDKPTTEDTRSEQSSGLSNQSLPWQSLTEDEEKSAQRKSASPSRSTSTSSAGGQPATGVATGRQTMPLPPTYVPGAPGATAQGVDPYGAMPASPTAYGPYGSPRTGGTSPGFGMAGPGMGMNLGGAGGATGSVMPPASGAAGWGIPPSPTPTASVGDAAMTDPGFGRYESMNMREATGPRQPAAIGDAQSQILQGSKPFSGWRPSSAYSPYMRLNDFNMRPNVNNYYQWVKPELDQQSQNRQISRNIQGLTDTARSGYQSLQSLQQRPGNSIPGAAPRTPATFMNTGQYYPDYTNK